MSGYNLRKRLALEEPSDKSDAKVVKPESEVHDNCNNDALPDEILVKIFEKLPFKERLIIEQVCKKWEHVGKNLSWLNERIFDNKNYLNLPEERVMQIKPFFDRCGSHLRHLSLRDWLFHVVHPFIRMVPNLQHLKLWGVYLSSKNFQELAQVLPHLKSLELVFPSHWKQNMTDYSLGLMECFNAMTSLEYLYIKVDAALFGQYPFVQFPPNLKCLCLYDVTNVHTILHWVAKGCKDLKGLRVFITVGGINENAFQAISQMKSLTCLAVPVKSIPYDVGYVFESLIELRALKINGMDEKIIAAITRHCKNLKHLHIAANQTVEISPEEHASLLRLATLPNLCSLEIWAKSYSKEQTTEFVNRLIANGNIQYMKMVTSKAALESEVLIEVLRRCKGIRSIALNFGFNTNSYSKICQVVDEIDKRDKQHGEFFEESHPTVEVQCNKKLARNITKPYKWLCFKDQISPPAVFDKWQYGSLSAGKPAWASLLL